jgi:hypothetical protein
MFCILLDLLDAAFNSPISEKDYHDVVRCIREYSSSRDSRSVEQELQVARGWPASYDACEHAERVRFAFVFGPSDNVVVRAAINKWDFSRRRDQLQNDVTNSRTT